MEVKEGPTAMLNITREELREDIREITTEVVKESQRTLIKMVNEDLAALRKDMALRKDLQSMERRLAQKIDTAISAHNRNPHAHSSNS